ncbi:MAG: DegT/DnrJ/EryC1/StrS family aminotransferase [Fimbriimonadaceae bacterium]|nr:DegT/DnrJ/EryC1/StrS family aminotransferase [Fimbriimonadaceae bacterium]
MAKLALLGGPALGAPAPEPHPRFTDQTIDRVGDLLRRGQTVGLNRNCAVIREAEAAIAAWHGVSECLGLSSGHAALHSALQGLGISTGDEVIVSPYTWGASVSCVLHAGAVPIFADVDPDTGLLDPASVEAAIGPRTAAILPVHLYGQPANLTALARIAAQHRLALIEDGSQAHGAVHAGRRVGSFGDAAGFSCMGGKLLATSEAGYLLTNSKNVYWRACLNTQHMGRAPEGDYPPELAPYVDSLVYTYRLSQLDAVLLQDQLAKLDDENAGRAWNVAALQAHLADSRVLSFPTFGPGDAPAYHMLSGNFDAAAAGVTRETWFRALRAEGVGVFAYVPSPIPTWPRLHWQTYDGPPIGWQATLCAAGVDYRQVAVPQAVAKIARSVEMGWNYLDRQPARMERLAAAFWKVEEQLDALRAWEHAEVVA